MNQQNDLFNYSFLSYRNTLKNYLQSGYAVTGFSSYIEQPRKKHLILRHDIDNSIEQAVKIARIDAATGCSSTFFLRVHALGYNLLSLPSLQIIKEIEELGHEVQLHLEGGLSEWLGGSNLDWANKQKDVYEAAVGKELKGFSTHEPARFGGIDFANELLEVWSPSVNYHAYESRFMMPEMKYLSDSSGRWREGHFGLWVDKEPLLQVLTHPFWWFEKTPAENY